MATLQHRRGALNCLHIDSRARDVKQHGVVNTLRARFNRAAGPAAATTSQCLSRPQPLNASATPGTLIGGNEASQSCAPLLIAASLLISGCNPALADALPQPIATAGINTTTVTEDSSAGDGRFDVEVRAPDPQADTGQDWWRAGDAAWRELRDPSELSSFLHGVDSSDSTPVKLKLVEFYASWCPACKAAAPELAGAAGDPSLTTHCEFARASVDRLRPVLKQYNITSIPTVMLFSPDGMILDSFHASAAAVKTAIQQHAVASPGAGATAAQSPAELIARAPSTSSSHDNPNLLAAAAQRPVSPRAACTTPDLPCTLPEASPAPAAASSTATAQALPGDSSQQTTAPDLQAAKAAFLQEAGAAYGYGGWLDAHYEAEIGSRLGSGQHYLDFTGSALYPRSLLSTVFEDLAAQTYGNPHSSSAASAAASISPSARSEEVMQAAASTVLKHLNADPAEYQVIFTRSATDALRMVGELFPWTPGSHFAYTRSNHNSVLGIGAYASDAGAQLQLLDADQVQPWLQQQHPEQLAVMSPVQADMGHPLPSAAAVKGPGQQPFQAKRSRRQAEIVWDAPDPGATLSLRQRPAVADGHNSSSLLPPVWAVSSSTAPALQQPAVYGTGLGAGWEGVSDSALTWQLPASAGAEETDVPPADPPGAPGDAAASPGPPSPAKQQRQQGSAPGTQRWRLPQDEYRRHRHLFKRAPWDPAMREYQADELRISNTLRSAGDINQADGSSILQHAAWTMTPAPATSSHYAATAATASALPEAPVISGEPQQVEQHPPVHHLLAYPAEDNFAGVVYPLDWIHQAHAATTSSDRWLVLLDAAAYLPTHQLDLTEHPADFVAMSFYKMFGYPTGLGALVVRTDAAPLLDKVYFGGGSVALATPEGCWRTLKCNPGEALTDGTPDFLGAAALVKAYDWWDNTLGGPQAVHAHTDSLAKWTAQQLQGLQHSNGAPLVRLYGAHAADASSSPVTNGSANTSAASSRTPPAVEQGCILNFSVLKADGMPVRYNQVEADALEAGLQLRSGCMCNPGACYQAVGLTAPEVQALAGRKEGCGDAIDTLRVQRPFNTAAAELPLPAATEAAAAKQELLLGMSEVEVPLGTVRASLGWASRFEDCWALVDFLKTSYI